MGIAAKGLSAIGKMTAVAVLLAAFLAGMAGVVYMSLSGSELRVPEITGKDFVESEKELASLGLRIKKRADRTSTEPINTILEQLPKAGETVKTGQLILVVVSKAGEADETPSSLKKNIDSDDTEKIEEMISDKPKKAKSNSNANTNKKTADTTRDVIANTATSTSNSNSGDTSGTKTDDPDKKDSGEKGGEKSGTGAKPQNTPAAKPAIKPAQRPPKPN